MYMCSVIDIHIKIQLTGVFSAVDSGIGLTYRPASLYSLAGCRSQLYTPVRDYKRGMNTTHTRLLFGSHETSLIIWLGKTAPAIQC